MKRTDSLSLRRLSTAIGAVVDGVDLREPLPQGTVAYLRQALLDHGAIFFQNQDLNPDQMSEFVSNFGTPIPEPFVSPTQTSNPVSVGDYVKTKHATAVWHADTSYVVAPPVLTALRAIRPPEFGGDTCWSSMYAAYDTLSEPMRNMLDRLTAMHSMLPVLERMGSEMAARYEGNKSSGVEHVHPVVLVHPETGRKALFVNEGWTTRIVELTKAESAHVLSLLFEHVKSPDFSMRWHWAPNDLALWDNRSVQHYAVPDYSSERIMQRVLISSEQPRGPW